MIPDAVSKPADPKAKEDFLDINEKVIKRFDIIETRLTELNHNSEEQLLKLETQIDQRMERFRTEIKNQIEEHMTELNSSMTKIMELITKKKAR